MRLQAFGSTGRQVPVLGQGTWNMERDDRARALAALERGIELGMTHIDTAELYGYGRVEQMIAPVVQRHRETLFLVSKVMPSNASRAGTIAACEKSLKLLGTDRLDCYLLHWPGSIPLVDTIAGLEALKEQGKILAWGVSNFDVADLERAERIAGPGKIACNQVLYHLQERAIEAAVLPWCDSHGVALVGYSPFGSGSFPGESDPGGRELARLAKARGCTARQLALAFLTRRPNLFAIPKASSAGHVEDNAGADALTLSDDEIKAIDKAFPAKARRGLPML